jgi:hypothetical protein
VCLPLETDEIISSITVESVFETVNKYKNITNNNSKVILQKAILN